MREFTITLETAGGIASPDTLDRLAEVIYETDVLTSPAVGIDQRTGAISAVFNVQATNLPLAGELGLRAFLDSLEAAGVRRDLRGRMHVEEEDVDVTRLTVELADDREPIPA